MVEAKLFLEVELLEGAFFLDQVRLRRTLGCVWLLRLMGQEQLEAVELFLPFSQAVGPLKGLALMGQWFLRLGQL